MKAKDKARTGTIRMLLSALQEEETRGEKHELDDAAVLGVIAREIKKRRESAEVYAANDREDLAEAERAEADILAGYQPTQLDESELAELVDTAVAAVADELGEKPGMKQMGQVMKLSKEKAAGRADGKRLSTAVKQRLQA